MWFSQGPFESGSFHGYSDKFTGLGVIFNNFRNEEGGKVHKDVQIVINDGTRTAEEMMSGPIVGCDASMRYHEERADFSVFNATRISLSYKDGSLTVGMDAHNQNDWVECVTTHVQLPTGWLYNAKYVNCAVALLPPHSLIEHI